MGYHISVLVMNIFILAVTSSNFTRQIINMRVEEMAFSKLAEKVKGQLARCMEHKDMPVNSMMEGTTRLGNYSPFFQTMVVMNQPIEDYIQTAYRLFNNTFC